MTNNNIYDLPKTATVSYYDVETDQNLTFEEWQQKQLNSSEITIINKSGSNFKSEKEGYGPTPFVRDVQLVVFDFPGSGRKPSVFQYRDGTIAEKIELKGIGEMKEFLRKLESEEVRLVLRTSWSKYERSWDHEKQVKEYLQKSIESLENNYWEFTSEYWGVEIWQFPVGKIFV